MVHLFMQTCTNQTISWLVRNYNTFGARTNHGQTRTHKIHHGPDLGEATTFPLIVYYVPSHETSTQMSFCPGTHLGVPKFPKLGLSQLWGPITLCINVRLRWKYEKYEKFKKFDKVAHGSSTLLTIIKGD